jgi:hypothetical protein
MRPVEWRSDRASLCDLWPFGVPGVLLPEVRDCAAEYGTTALFGGSDPPP